MCATWQHYNYLIVQLDWWDIRNVSSHIKRSAERRNCITTNTLVRRSSGCIILNLSFPSPRSQLHIQLKRAPSAIHQIHTTECTYMVIAYICICITQINNYNRYTSRSTPIFQERWHLWEHSSVIHITNISSVVSPSQYSSASSFVNIMTIHNTASLSATITPWFSHISTRCYV